MARMMDRVMDRADAERKGRRAELYIAFLYQLRGYRILARRFSSHSGEIDLVALRGQTLAFVEVKARKTLDTAVFAVTPKARKRIESASRAFIARNPACQACGVRFDIAAVAGLKHRIVQDAWRTQAR